MVLQAGSEVLDGGGRIAQGDPGHRSPIITLLQVAVALHSVERAVSQIERIIISLRIKIAKTFYLNEKD